MIKHTIHFYGRINPVSFERLRNIVLQALFEQERDKLHEKSLTILLSSEGGDLNTGFTAYNFFRALPVPVTMINMGTVESIAVPVYLSADTRLALDNSRFLLHSFHWGFNAGACDHQRLAEYSASLDFDAERYADIFEERTKGAQSPINVRECLYGRAKILDAATAANTGIATDIITPDKAIDVSSTQWWVNTCS